MDGLYKATLTLHAAFVVVCRGALFFPVCIDIVGHLFEVAGGRTSSEMLVGPAILIGCVHLAMVVDAMKDAMFCASPTVTLEPGTPLHPADMTSPDVMDSPTPERRAKGLHSESDATSRASKPKKAKRPKGHRKGTRGQRTAGGVDLDEEMTFGFAGNGFDNEYDDDADDDASMVGDRPAATFRTRTSNGNISPTGPLKDQPRYDGAGRMPSSFSKASTPSRSEGSVEAAHRTRVADLEMDKARLRKELDDARREMEDRQQQDRDKRRAERAAREAATARQASSASAARQASAKVESADHAAIFASGVIPARCNHYSMLGVQRSAGPEEIKKAYNKLAMKWCVPTRA